MDSDIQAMIEALIPPKATQSTEDQVRAVNGQPWLINSAFNSLDNLTSAINGINTQQGGNDSSTLGYIPLSLLRVFHPKASGYGTVAYSNIQTMLGSWTSNATNYTAPDPAVINVDQGNLQCLAQHNDGDPKYYFGFTGAANAISQFCTASVDAKIVLGPGNTGVQEIAENDQFGQTLDVSAESNDASGCPPPFDFSQDGAIVTCEEYLQNTIDDCKFCPTKRILI
jgi:hypothetical protein